MAVDYNIYNSSIGRCRCDMANSPRIKRKEQAMLVQRLRRMLRMSPQKVNYYRLFQAATKKYCMESRIYLLLAH